MKAIAVIPARYDSSRLPGKPLLKLDGKPIIQHVWQRVRDAELFDRIIIGTDDQRIYDQVVAFGGEVALTSKKHQSGTDRVAEVCQDIDCDLVFNVQGDEPFISREPLKLLLDAFSDPGVTVSSLMHTLRKEIDNPDQVKVVCNNNNFALYFSRSRIPFLRDKKPDIQYWGHIGVYAFRREVLLQFVNLPLGMLEQIEKLEQLRMLENGIPIKMIETQYSGFGIDTPEDLEKAEIKLRKV
ncbi:MAG: 3-deoxy-manno-octulosonate cytidylyltransferase, partial [Candidatus Cloacimonetes bacterium]|nr:3-deoxy-manno-octulosonate cytidylyltransferase [Candidatus Cloacimonadota bacterium]